MGIKIYGAKAFRSELKGMVRDLRPAWLLEELGLPYERISLDPTKGENKTEAYLKINPTGKVPTLVDDQITLFESGAICEYLAESHQKFIPAPGSTDYYICKQWCYFALTNLEPLAVRLFATEWFFEKNQTTADIKKMTLEGLPRFLGTLETVLSKQSYLVGESFSIADIFLGTCLSYLTNSKILNDYPALNQYWAKLSDRPAYKKAFAINGQ